MGAESFDNQLFELERDERPFDDEALAQRTATSPNPSRLALGCTVTDYNDSVYLDIGMWFAPFLCVPLMIRICTNMFFDTVHIIR